MAADTLLTETRAVPSVRGQYSRTGLIRLAVGFTLLQLLVAWSIDGVSLSADLRRALHWDSRIALGSLVGLIVGTVVGVGMAVLIRRSPPFGTIAERVVPLADWASFRPVDYVLIALCAGLGEEVLFRGALQPVTGVVVQAILFGLLHWTCKAHVGIAVSAGLVFGFIAQISGSVWPAVAAHFAVDLTTGLALGAALRRGWIDAAGRFIAAEPSSPAI